MFKDRNKGSVLGLNCQLRKKGYLSANWGRRTVERKEVGNLFGGLSEDLRDNAERVEFFFFLLF